VPWREECLGGRSALAGGVPWREECLVVWDV
jgi:hypothetical protein